MTAGLRQPPMIEAIQQLLAAARERAVDDSAAAECDAIGGRLNGPLRVAIAGRVKAGKSTLLNALVGEELAPTDSGECTSIVTWYTESDRPEVTLKPAGGTAERVRFDRKGGALEVDLGGRRPSEVESLHVRWPSSRLRNLALIDTPGMESISTELSARTLNVLTPDGDRPPDVDAVLYLMRHAHASDARFLEAFHETDRSSGSPMNTVGVLSRADEIGSCRLDAMEVAGRVAARYRTDPRLRRLCPVIVPVAGLLGHAGVTLHEHEYRVLAQLAQADTGEVEELLLTADRFGFRPSDAAPDTSQRLLLLDRVGLFGVRLAVELIRTGTVAGASALADELGRRSGLEALRGVLLRQFAQRSKVLKARSALLAINALLRDGRCSDHRRLQAASEQIEASAHAFEEVRLLDRLRSDQFAFAADRRNELEQLLGGGGHDPFSRLGLAPETDDDALRSVADDALRRWQSIAEHPLTGRAEQLAARSACRSVEGILVSLTS